MYYSIDIAQVILFPNPAQDVIYVTLKRFSGETGTLQVIDAMGRQVLQKHLPTIADYPVELQLNELENGIYFLSVQVEGKKWIGKRFVVEGKQ